MKENLAWLESLASMTQQEIENSLNDQSVEIQQAYEFNDSSLLKNFFGAEGKLACKNTIFSLN